MMTFCLRMRAGAPRRRSHRLLSLVVAVIISTLLVLPAQPARAALPVVTLSSTGVTYNEGVGNMIVDPGLLVSDTDSGDTIQSATITLRVYVTGQDVLGITSTPSGLTFAFDTINGVATIAGSATPAVYTTALRNVYYANSSPNPNVTARPIDFEVRDSGTGASPSGNSTVVTRTITILANPSAPTITGLSNTSTGEDIPKVVSFTLADADTPISALTLTATSSNPVLVPNQAANLAFGGGGAEPDRTVTVTPAANQTGTADITIRVSDGTSATSSTFRLTVDPSNDAPTISAIGAQTTPASTVLTVPFTVGDVDGPTDITSVTAISANTALVPNANIAISGTGVTRMLTITPTQGITGTSTITVTVTDAGGLTALTNFVLTVTAGTSQAPTIAAIAPQTTPEDTPIVVIATVADADTPVASLTLNVISSNPTVVPNANVVAAGTGSSRTLTIAPAANQTTSVGSPVTLIVTVSDGTLTSTITFTLAVTAVNDAPTVSAIGAQSTSASTVLTVPFTVGDVDGLGDISSVTAISANTALVPNASIAVGGAGATRTLTITPTPGVAGTSTITVTVTDAGSLTALTNFVLTVTAGTSQAPSIAAIAPQTTNEDTPVAVNVTLSDNDSPASSLTLTGFSSNPIVVPNSGIVASGSGALRTVTVTPAANQSTPVGSPVTITLTVSDGTLTGSTAFTLAVVAVGDAPTISPIADQTTPLNVVTAPIAFQVGDGDTALNALSLSATSSNSTLVANTVSSFSFFGSGADRTLTVTPAQNQTGATTIEVAVSDGTSTSRATFVLTVTSGAAPQLSSVADQFTNRNIAAGPIPFSVSDADTPVAQVTVAASSSNTQLAPTANVVIQGSGTVRTVTVTPASNEIGSTTITLTASDGTHASFASFQLTVNPLPPAVTANNTLTISRGNSAPITSSLLQVSDPDTSPAGLRFTVVSPPTAGTITKNGAPASAFTQADLNAGRIQYANGGSSRATDSFDFTVTDGTTTVRQTFGISLVGPATVCEPRTPVRVTTRAIGGGRLEATIAATGLDVPLSNRLRSIGVGNAANARVFVSGALAAANSTVTLPAGTVEVTVIVERVTPGQGTTVPLTVTDSCGVWPTFVGGGPGAF